MVVTMKVTSAAAILCFPAGSLAQQWFFDQITPNSFKNQQPLALSKSCQDACFSLQQSFASQVILPGDKLYSEELASFWSQQQAQTLPGCVFLPTSTADVSVAVQTLQKNDCHFAVKSGGHVPFAGASNIANGVTIDLSKLKDIAVNEKDKTVAIGPGNKWIDVYQRLSAKNITVIGGRIGEVGVGGLTLGGGLSFFSSMHGLACDNVASYEVVIANGDTLIASPMSNSDLYWALRGGGNNFGIVTKFHLSSYPHDGNMWVGKIRHPAVQNTSLTEAFVHFGETSKDVKAAPIFSVLYLHQLKEYLCVTEMNYAEPMENEKIPEVFEPFFAVADPLETRKESTSIIAATNEHSASNPSGLRQTYWTTTFRLDASLIQYAIKSWKEVVNPLKEAIPGYIPVITFQLISEDTLGYMSKQGGNALGFEDEDGPLVIVLASSMWSDRGDDEKIYSAYTTWLAKTVAKAKSLDLQHPYLYMNYASQFQDPITSYGEKSVARLKDVALKYDPNGIFQKLQPGHFKL